MFRAVFLASTFLVTLNGQNFDVASVRPHAPDDIRFLVRQPTGGHFTAEGVVGKLLVMLAYGVQDSQITGGPTWFATEKWDIEAKCDDNRHTVDETLRMLQNLLEERFSLKIHRATGQRPVYALIVAKGGPKFKPSENHAGNLHISTNSISMQGGSITDMTKVLATALGRPVIDRTGLTGLYDVFVQWDDAPIREGGVPGMAVPQAHEASADSERGSIFTAVQDQLGLRLEGQRAPVEVIVVDSMGRPSAN